MLMQKRMKLIFLFAIGSILLCGCGGGNHGSSARSSATNGGGSSSEDINGGFSGKIYYDSYRHYHELDVFAGISPIVYNYDFGYWATPRRDGQEFAIGLNRTSADPYENEDIVFLDRTGQEIDRRIINGEVQDIVRISPDGRYYAFNWYKNSEKNGLAVLERNSTWERDFDLANGRGFDWTSDGKLVFARGNVIYKVDELASSEAEVVATLPLDTWKYALGLSVSPDNKKIAFWFKSEGAYEGHVFVVGMDGSDFHQVTTSNLWEHSVDWSPDGKYLAVVKGAYLTNVPDGYYSEGGQGNIVPMLYVVKADARNVDVSADYPKEATTIRVYQQNNSIDFLHPDSPIAWR